MNLELFIARKIHFSKVDGGRKVTPPAIRIAISGIALGLATMIVAVAVVVGFKKEVRNKVIGFGSHIQITNFDSNSSYETNPVYVNDSLLNALSNFPSIQQVETYATKPGILKTETDFQGIILKGIDQNYNWAFLQEHLKEGEPITIHPDTMSTEVLISRYQANLLGLKCNDSFLAYFVQEDVRPRKFHIKGIYDTGFLDYDKLFVVADIKQVRRLNSWDDDAVSGIELLVNDYNQLDAISENLYFHMIDKQDRAGNTFYVRSVKELNPMIFSWLNILDINVVIILILMISVAGFTMIAGLLIIILERTHMIGILKALGEPDNRLRKIFLYIASFLIGKGMVWGNLTGLLICFLQANYHLIPLDPSNYYLDAVPIDLTISSWFLINLGTLAISMLMMWGPSYLITKINPAQTIRFE